MRWFSNILFFSSNHSLRTFKEFSTKPKNMDIEFEKKWIISWWIQLAVFSKYSLTCCMVLLSLASHIWLIVIFFASLIETLKLLLISFASTAQKRNKNMFVLKYSGSAINIIPFKHYSHLRLKYRTIRHQNLDIIKSLLRPSIKPNSSFLSFSSWDKWLCWFRWLSALL